jgi:hypothetical protein
VNRLAIGAEESPDLRAEVMTSGLMRSNELFRPQNNELFPERGTIAHTYVSDGKLLSFGELC